MYKNNFNLLRLYGAFQVLLQHSLYYLSNDNSREDNYTFFIGNLIQQFHGVTIFFLLSCFLIFKAQK